jgi:hypothetical protein
MPLRDLSWRGILYLVRLVGPAGIEPATLEL